MKLGVKGIWFYGLAGSGKTFSPHILKKKLDSSFVIDGDEVRKHISFDLGYSIFDRVKHIERLIGLNRLVLKNIFSPICSSVFMSQKILKQCKNKNIKVIKSFRSFDQIKKIRKIYDLDKYVIGKDIKENEIYTENIFNDGTYNFKCLINNYVL